MPVASRDLWYATVRVMNWYNFFVTFGCIYSAFL